MSITQEENSFLLTHSYSPQTAGLFMRTTPLRLRSGVLARWTKSLRIREYQEQPRIMKMPPRAGLPLAVIAVWGKVGLEPLDSDAVRQAAVGINLKKGILVDFQNDFKASARNGLPVYHLTGSAGYVWIATVGPNGTGTLRFLTIGPSAIITTASITEPTPPSPGQQGGIEAQIAQLQDALTAAQQRAAQLETEK
jgi:hypothetical protein